MFLNKKCFHSHIDFGNNEGLNSTKCDCFHDDHSFYTRSFVRPKGRVQFFDKKDGEIFVRESRPKKSMDSKFTSNPDFFDPLHKANLCFFLYLNETDGDEGELLKIRPMKLDDETISLNEPYTKNSGYVQGRIFYRQKVPRANNPIGVDALTWKDLHVGEDILLFGRRYRINFLRDRGIDVPTSDAEQIPVDAWNMNRHFGVRVESKAEQLQNLQNPNYRTWEQIPSTLIFHAAWLDAKTDFNGVRMKRTFRLILCTSDDTVTVVETTPGFNNALFLRSCLLPYRTKDGILRHYRAPNFRPGLWIEVYKRPMFIYDCEGEATIDFVQQQFGDVEFGHCSISLLEAGPPLDQAELRPFQFVFSAENVEFPNVEFLLIYNLNTQRMDICEMNRHRRWVKGRPFLIDVDASHLDVKKLQVGTSLSLFRWTFKFLEAHPTTQKYLDSVAQQTQNK